MKKLLIINLLLVCALSACVGLATRMVSYPNSKPHYEIHNGLVYHYFPNAGGGTRFLLEGADADSFVQLDDRIGKDKNFVYRLEYKQKNIDAKTYKKLKHGFFVDKNSIYDGTSKILGDPKFIIVLTKINYMDKDNVYYTNEYKFQKAKSEKHLRGMGASEKLITEIRRVRSKRGWTLLPK